MLSAPPVLVEPKEIFVGEVSPVAPEYFEWATQTPEPSPLCLLKVPSAAVDEHFCVFQKSCSPVWEEMLTRLARHADILEAVDSSVRKQLIQTLCQPFFEHVVDTVCSESDSSRISTYRLKDERQKLNLGQRLGTFEEESTDADSDSAFATLFSSDAEECEGERVRDMEHASESSQSTPRFAVLEEDSVSAQDTEKSQMVCRHWKSKGWCRYQCQCKFLHPENKRGIGAKSPSDISDVPSSASTQSTRRRGGKNRRCPVSLDSRLDLPNSWDARLLTPPSFCQGVPLVHFQTW
jgi:hypothetical protein